MNLLFAENVPNYRPIYSGNYGSMKVEKSNDNVLMLDLQKFKMFKIYLRILISLYKNSITLQSSLMICNTYIAPHSNCIE